MPNEHQNQAQFSDYSSATRPGPAPITTNLEVTQAVCGRDNPLILDDSAAANVLAVPVDGHDGRPVVSLVTADDANVGVLLARPQIRAAGWLPAVHERHDAIVAGFI